MGLTVCIESDGCKEVGRTHKGETQKNVYEVNTVFFDA